MIILIFHLTVFVIIYTDVYIRVIYLSKKTGKFGDLKTIHKGSYLCSVLYKDDDMFSSYLIHWDLCVLAF